MTTLTSPTLTPEDTPPTTPPTALLICSASARIGNTLAGLTENPEHVDRLLTGTWSRASRTTPRFNPAAPGLTPLPASHDDMPPIDSGALAP